MIGMYGARSSSAGRRSSSGNWHNPYAPGSALSSALGNIMGSPVQRRWPRNAESARLTTIDHCDAALALLDEARAKLAKRDHPAITALDIADAAYLILDIKRLMTEAKVGIE